MCDASDDAHGTRFFGVVHGVVHVALLRFPLVNVCDSYVQLAFHAPSACRAVGSFSNEVQRVTCEQVPTMVKKFYTHEDRQSDLHGEGGVQRSQHEQRERGHVRSACSLQPR
jgi:hypothetical protein